MSDEFNLRQHWNESLARERANPPADQPTHAEMLAHGLPAESAPRDALIWVIEPGSTGTFLAQWMHCAFFVHEAGDLWPSRPSHWLSRSAAAALVAGRP